MRRLYERRQFMNILFLDGAPAATLHSGKSVRMVNLLKRLGRRHALHYVALLGPADADGVPGWLRPLVASARVWKRAERPSRLGRYVNWVTLRPWFYARWRYPDDYHTLSARVRRLVNEERIELIHAFDEEVAQFIPEEVPCPWVADPGDAMALHALRRAQHSAAAADRLHWRLQAWRLRHYERDMVRRADATVFVSPVDAALYVRNGTRSRVHVIPNGVDTDGVSPSLTHVPCPTSHVPALLFTGHMSYGPNVDAAQYLCDEILPLIRAQVPDVVCIIAGADPTDEVCARHDGRSVIVTGVVEDLRPYFEQATVSVCPMRLGAGVKNKLLEAMAMGKAIVTTRLATDGLNVHDGVHLRIAGNTADTARVLIELLRDAEQCRRLGAAARAYVETHHQWDRVAERYDALYKQLVNGVTDRP